MNLLLDTHVAIWALSAPEYLKDAERALIADPRNEVHVSAVTVFEIAVKHSLARKTAPPFSARVALSLFEEAGFKMIDVTARHAEAVETLPLLHADPFDRLLVAQALTEPLRLMTHDTTLQAYDPSIMLF